LPGGISGVKASELVMLAEVEQRLDPPQPHTVLRLAQPLAYTYRRDTVTIYGNVVKATHGETRTQVLGSGNASQELQAFPLQQFPVTYLSAPTAAGAVSTLQVRVNDILWHETNSLATLESGDRQFMTQTDDAGQTTVIFGNGRQGARPPSGIENIRAVYRTGIGKAGNAKAEQISLLATRPLGVKSVINPLPATGGTDPESRDQARRNLPLALMALDRLVSVQDYADFARTYAGIGKASAVRLSDGQRQLVHLTIAGVEDSPIDEHSDLYRNFQQALQDLGDPNQPVKIEPRELLLLVIAAKVQILPDYLWETVVAQIRVALLETFSFDRRDLGQPVFLSEVIRTIQQVPGVAYVDVDTFGGIPEKITDPRTKRRRLQVPSEIIELIQALITDSRQPLPFVGASLAGTEDGTIHPAQIAYLTPEVPDTLILNRIP
jgi:predicted phage baseplate assembly protein